MSGNGRRGGAKGELVVVGDALLDRDLEGHVERLSPEAPVPVVDDPVEATRPGGAALAAALAAADGREVTLVSALAGDAAGAELAALVAAAGVTVIDLGLAGPTPEKVRVRAGGRTMLRVDRGAPPNSPIEGPARALEALRAALARAGGVLVSDYGRGVTAHPAVRAALAGRPAGTPLVWDPHPRGTEPTPGAALVTPNAGETATLAPEAPASSSLAAAASRAQELARRWEAEHVCVTRGAEGALLARPTGTPVVVPAVPSDGGDACGAGDRFASRAAGRLADGATPVEAVADAVRSASEFVAAGGAACGVPAAPAAADLAVALEAPPLGLEAAEAVIDRVRTARGTVVATGGCFDLLHAGHVSTLQAARSLGDCLVVLLNSDRSVARLKGSERPLVSELDRAAVLSALGCVDAVVLFEEDTPLATLDRLRPDLFAKGADYSVADLPEAALLAGWGGQAVTLPYMPGRSTSGLIREVTLRGVA